MKAFFDVDTQNDFMGRTGALYVKDAEELHSTLKRLTRYATRFGIILGSMDKHKRNDKEFEIFGPHCIENTYGQLKIPETYTVRSIFVPNEPVDNLELMVERLKKREVNSLYLEKQNLDVFTNQNADKVVRLLGASEYFVYGVALDYCVYHAVEGLLKRGYKVNLIGDATKAVNISPEDGKNFLEMMVASGAKLIKASEVLRE